MKKRVVALLVCCMLILLCACRGAKKETVKSVDSIQGIDFQVPESWNEDNLKVKELLEGLTENALNAKAEGTAFELADNGAFMIIRLDMPGEMKSQDKDKMVTTMRNGGLTNINAEVQKTQEVELGGQKADKVDFDVTAEGEKGYGEIVVANHENSFFMLLIMGASKNEKSMGADMKALLESVAFRSVPTAATTTTQAAGGTKEIAKLTGLDFFVPDNWLETNTMSGFDTGQFESAGIKIEIAELADPTLKNMVAVVQMSMPGQLSEIEQKAFFANVKKGGFGKMENVKESRTESLTVAGKKAELSAFSGTSQGRTVYAQMVMINSGKTLYVFFVVGQTQEAVEQNAPIVLDSVRLK